MLFIPAIDIKDGQCVRLRQGDMSAKADVDVFAKDPLEMAAKFVDQGAKRLHLVDLDGAKQGKPVNQHVVKRIAEAFPDLPIQIGGGIRDEDTIAEYLNLGAQYVILGTRVINEPHLLGDLCLEFPRHIIVGLDAKEGKVATDGWSKLHHHDVYDMAKHFENDGVEAIIYTDISRDGMMQGVNAESTRKMALSVNVPVFASGGISGLDCVRDLLKYEQDGIAGMVMGRALYEGAFTLPEAMALDNNPPPIMSTEDTAEDGA